MLAMAGMIMEPRPPTMMCRRDRSKEREEEEAQASETEASVEAIYGSTSHESMSDNLELLDIEEMVKILTAQDTLRTDEGRM